MSSSPERPSSSQGSVDGGPRLARFGRIGHRGTGGAATGDHRTADRVLRGSDAAAVSAADFSVNLRARPPLPDDRLAEAHAVGFAAGWAQGRLEAAEAEQAMAVRAAAEAARIHAEQAERFERALGALSLAASRLEQRSLPTLESAEQLIVRSAVQLAEALLGAELRHLPEPARAALERLLSDVPGDDPLVVRLSPGDLAELDPEGTGEFEADGRTIGLIADPGLADGDAIGECGPVTIDARLGAALQRVKEVLETC